MRNEGSTYWVVYGDKFSAVGNSGFDLHIVDHRHRMATEHRADVAQVEQEPAPGRNRHSLEPQPALQPQRTQYSLREQRADQPRRDEDHQ